MTRRAAVAVAVAVGVAGARAATVGYPGGPPCDTTLQACVDGVPAGTRIEIATTGPFDEGLKITKSVTITGAAGIRPVLGASATARQIFLGDTAAAPVDIVLQGLTLSNGSVRIRPFSSTGPDTIEIADCGISNAGAFAVSIEPTVPGTIAIHDSDLASGGYVVDSLTEPTGPLVIALRRNRMTSSTPGFGGVNLDLRGSGQTTVDVEDNVIHDVAQSGVYVDTVAPVQATVRVVNDTIDRPGKGFTFMPTSGSTLDVEIFNTIVAHATGPAVLVANSTGLTIGAGFNDFFGNGAPDQLMGFSLGTLFAVDPLFVDEAGADYHLKAGSFLVDHGTATPPGGLPPLDADGDVRVAGAGVDVGAFEFGATPPTTTTTTLPGCPTGAAFASVDCRLSALLGDVRADVPAGRTANRLAALVATALHDQQTASSARTRRRRRKLGQAVHALSRFERLLGSKAAHSVDAGVRSALAGRADGIRADLSTLRAQ